MTPKRYDAETEALLAWINRPWWKDDGLIFIFKIIMKIVVFHIVFWAVALTFFR